MGKIIALSGVDNAGKSTQSKLIENHLSKSNKTVFVTEFAFSYYLLKPLIKYLRKSTGSPSGGPVAKNTNSLFRLWFVFAYLDIWIGYLSYLRPLKKKYDVVICDRFYCDIWANLLYYGYMPNWAFDKLLRFLPKADVQLLFVVEPAVGHRRIKDEFPLSYYKKQTYIYKKLAKLDNFVTLDASKEKKEIFRIIKRHLPELT